MSRLICNAAAPSLNAAVVVCVWGGHTHSTHTCTSYFISYAFSFPIRWLTSSAKQKNVQRLSVRIRRRQLHVLCVKSAWMDGDIVGLTNRTIDRLSDWLDNWPTGRVVDWLTALISVRSLWLMTSLWAAFKHWVESKAPQLKPNRLSPRRRLALRLWEAIW